MPFPWRNDRCHVCRSLAVGYDSDNRPCCIYHLPGALKKTNYKNLYEEDAEVVYDMLGKAEWDRLFELRFPGPEDIPFQVLYEWVHELREKLEKERSQADSPNHMTWEQAERLRMHYYCSDCWGELHAEKIGENLYHVICRTEGCTTPAYISDRAVKYRTRMSDHYHYLVRRSLPAALFWIKAFDDRTAKSRLLKELGIKENV